MTRRVERWREWEKSLTWYKENQKVFGWCSIRAKTKAKEISCFRKTTQLYTNEPPAHLEIFFFNLILKIFFNLKIFCCYYLKCFENDQRSESVRCGGRVGVFFNFKSWIQKYYEEDDDDDEILKCAIYFLKLQGKEGNLATWRCCKSSSFNFWNRIFRIVLQNKNKFKLFVF